MTFLVNKNTVLFSAVYRELKIQWEGSKILTLREAPIVKRGALLISSVSLIGLTIFSFCLVSTLLIHVALKKPISPETAHELVCTLHIFKTCNESSDKSVD